MKRQHLLRIGLSIILIVFIAGCRQDSQNIPASQEEQITDTGILSITSSPSAAQAYVNGEFKGETPLDLYNFPVGTYTITVKKNGYSDFEKSASVKVGVAQEVDAKLNALPTDKTSAQTNEKNKSTAIQEPKNEMSRQKLNVANISGSFIIYYDFKKGLFTETASGNPDAFSSNYGSYIYFTAYSPSMMRIFSKPIENTKKEDCQFLSETVANLYSGQTLCVQTTDGRIAAIGGKWTEKADTLEWILFG